MVCGWMAWSGLWVLGVQYVGNFSLPESGSIILFLVFCSSPLYWRVLAYMGSMKTVVVVKYVNINI